MKKNFFHAILFLGCVILMVSRANIASGEGTHIGNGSVKSLKATVAQQPIDGKNFKANVVIDSTAKTVTISSTGGALPANVEFKLKAKAGDSQTIALQADKAAAPTRFTGKVDPWKDGYVSFEFRYSADKKQWDSVTRTISL